MATVGVLCGCIANKRIMDFCKALPKIELHAHLNGSLSKQTLKELGVHDESIAYYQKMVDSLKRKERSLNECFKLFKVAHDATKNSKALYIATKNVIEEFHKDNVVYLELRTTPKEVGDMTQLEYIEACVKAIVENKNPIIIKLILSIDRQLGPTSSIKTLDTILKMKAKYPDIIRGIDLSGNPKEGFFDEKLFIRARQNGLFVTLHCAEIINNEEVLQMLKFKPDRLGHGTCLHPDHGGSEETWKTYAAANIPTECCLTSTVLCGTSVSYKEHHVKEWLKWSLPFSLCTDDKGIFGTSCTEEYAHAEDSFNLSKKSLWDISYNAIEFCFASSDEKNTLRNKLNEWKDLNAALF